MVHTGRSDYLNSLAAWFCAVFMLCCCCHSPFCCTTKQSMSFSGLAICKVHAREVEASLCLKFSCLQDMSNKVSLQSFLRCHVLFWMLVQFQVLMQPVEDCVSSNLAYEKKRVQWKSKNYSVICDNVLKDMRKWQEDSLGETHCCTLQMGEWEN